MQAQLSHRVCLGAGGRSLFVFLLLFKNIHSSASGAGRAGRFFSSKMSKALEPPNQRILDGGRKREGVLPAPPGIRH